MRKMILAALMVATAAPAFAQASGSGDPAASSAPASTRHAVASAYTLGAGDKLKITVYEEPDLTGTYQVTDSGEVSMPLIGNVPAAGTHLSDLQAVIALRLSKGYVKDPKVAVELAEYRPFYILGEINKAGEYPYRVGLTVDQAVAAAGGYSYRANMKFVWLRRADEDNWQKINLRGSAVRLMPGDTIRVGERYF